MTDLLKELEAVAEMIPDDWDWYKCKECGAKTNGDTWPEITSFIRTHHAEIAEAVRDAYVLRIERDIARAKADRCVQILTSIHTLLYPPAVQVNGMTYAFRPPNANEWTHRLCDRIRAIPDELDAMHNSAREVGE